MHFEDFLDFLKQRYFEDIWIFKNKTKRISKSLGDSTPAKVAFAGLSNANNFCFCPLKCLVSFKLFNLQILILSELYNFEPNHIQLPNTNMAVPTGHALLPAVERRAVMEASSRQCLGAAL